MVYELYGLPGSGKSYYCKKMEIKDNIKDIYSFYKDKFIGKIIFHFFLYLFKINKNLRNKYQQILNIIGEREYINRIDNRIDFKIYIKYIIFVYFLELREKKNIIIDEGIFHYCTALYAEFDIEYDKVDKIIELLKIDKFKEIYRVSCDVEHAIIQIKKRNRKQTAIDFLKEKELKELLIRYYKIGEYFQNKYKIMNIEELLAKKGISYDKV